MGSEMCIRDRLLHLCGFSAFILFAVLCINQTLEDKVNHCMLGQQWSCPDNIIHCILRGSENIVFDIFLRKNTGVVTW